MAYQEADKIADFSPVYRLITGFVFWFTLFFVILWDVFVFRLRVIGGKYLRRHYEKGCFLVSNHSLYFDPAIIAHIVAPRRCYYSAMFETFQIRYLGSYIRSLGAFPIPKLLPLRKLIRPVSRMLRMGRFVHFFPEGDLKHLSSELADFQMGVFFLAHLFDVPVIPITLVTHRYKRFGELLSRFFVRVTAVVGEPVYPEHRHPGGGESSTDGGRVAATHSQAQSPRHSGATNGTKRRGIEVMAERTHKAMSEVLQREHVESF